ncbi:beta-N-acetylhexosaminidase [candidate division KSB1 bacterium]
MIPETSTLSLEQKIGQMFMFGFSGNEPSAELKELIRTYHLGNVIVFARNFANAGDLRHLCRLIYSEFTIPPLIAIDQEGGVVIRITEGASLLPGNMALAATGDPNLAFEYGKITGREMRALGLNLNLAPVLDVNHKNNPGIGVRSFGDNADIVSEFGVSMIKGLQSEHIFSTGKHFPGKGAATLDTHLDLAVIKKRFDELESSDIVPFQKAVESGVECIMTSHAAFPAFSPGKPAQPGTFTAEIMTDYLRHMLGFEGVLITDDLEMGAAAKSADFNESIRKSVLAGADILCVCRSFELQRSAVDTLTAAVRSGAILEARIDRSVRRILALKRRFVEKRELFFAEDIDMLVNEHAETVRKIVDRSIQVHDDAGLVPLRIPESEKILTVIPQLQECSPVEELKPFFRRAEQTIVQKIRAFHKNCDFIHFNLPPDESDMRSVLNAARASQVTLFCSYNAHLDPVQSDLLRALTEHDGKIILLMLRNPFDREISSRVKASVALHAPIHTVIERGIEKLFGI